MVEFVTLTNGVLHSDESILEKGKFVLAVDTTQEALLRHEDLDGDGLITIDDCGPKVKGSLGRFEALGC